MLKDNDYLNIYNDYDYKLYCSTGNGRGAEDFVLEPKFSDDEPNYYSVQFSTVRYLKEAVRTRRIRIEKQYEEEVYKSLRIDFAREKNLYGREQMHEMIINSNDEIIKEILSITDFNIVDMFLSEYISLESTNQYDLSSKLVMYIRARLEELKEGKKKTELDPTPSLNQRVIEKVVEVEKIVEIPVETAVVEEPKKEKPKATATSKTTPKTSTSKAKTGKK